MVGPLKSVRAEVNCTEKNDFRPTDGATNRRMYRPTDTLTDRPTGKILADFSYLPHVKYSYLHDSHDMFILVILGVQCVDYLVKVINVF